MIKADIVEKVSKTTGLTQTDAFGLVEQVFEILKSTLETGDKIKIAGFGNFVVRTKSDRRGRNPQTGEEIVIASRKVLTFKPSPVLKLSLNK